GRLQCMGGPSYIASRFGTDYVLTFLHHSMSHTDGEREEGKKVSTADQLVSYLHQHLSSECYIKSTYGGSTTILVPRHRLSMIIVENV
ncbi:hypothetical protein KIPB_014538, partial [Kipferlia bialata]